MHTKEWKVLLALVCGLGVCVAGFGGLALRLAPHAPSAPAISAEEDECDESAPPPAQADMEV